MGNFTDRMKKFPWLMLVVFLLSITLIGRTLSRTFQSKELELKAHKWDKLMLIMNQIEQNYVDTIDYKSITESAIPLILENLDPHSVYLPPKELKVAEESLEGNFGGIGIQFNVPSDTAIVINVIAGGPSERAGLLSGDRVVMVDTLVVAGVKMNQDSLMKRMRGEIGSKVNISVKRVGEKNLIEFPITRGKITVNSVDVSYMVDDTTGFIKLSKFSRTSYDEVNTHLSELKKSGMKRAIFDLRDNAGGYLDQALLISNEFLDKGKLVVYMEGANRKREDFFADGKGKFKDIDLSILLNEGSASSSEIFAGAMQDNDRALIYGRRSFGKGLVQEPIYFSDKSGIRLTVARFYTPTGRSIQKPYSKDYMYDIVERYKHGEMVSEDSIRKNESLKFTTPKGRVVYGGGGISPDRFIPLDTVGITALYLKISRQALAIKFSIDFADKYRTELRGIDNLKKLNRLFSSVT